MQNAQTFKNILIINIAWIFALLSLVVPFAYAVSVGASVPATTITRGPGGADRTTAVPRAYFEYNTGGTTAGYTYMCQLDNFGWEWCDAPLGSKGYANIPNGSHTFKVKAGQSYTDDDTGQTFFNWGPETSYTWTSYGEVRDDIIPGDITYGGGLFAVHSSSSSLVTNDNNGMSDVFVGMPNKGYLKASSASDGSGANGPSFNPSLDSKGIVVAFETRASNIISNDTNLVDDVIVRNLKEKTLERITNISGTQIGPSGGINYKKAAFQPSVSAFGNKVAYTTEYGPSSSGGTANNKQDVFVYDVSLKKSTYHIGEGREPSISRAGRYIAFTSDARLLPADTDNMADIYVRDTSNNTLKLVSVTNSGTQLSGNNQLPDISENGRYVAFEAWSNDTSLGDNNANIDIYVRDLALNQTIWISKTKQNTSSGNSTNPSISGLQRSDGTFSVAYTTTDPNLCTEYYCMDGNGKSDVMQWIGKDNSSSFRTVIQSRKENSLTATNGSSSNAVMSNDGAFIMFQSNALDSYTGNQHANTDTYIRGWWPNNVPSRDSEEKISSIEPTYPGVPQIEPNLPGPLPSGSEPNIGAWSATVASLMGSNDVAPLAGQPNYGNDDYEDKIGVWCIYEQQTNPNLPCNTTLTVGLNRTDSTGQTPEEKAQEISKKSYDACIARGIASPMICYEISLGVYQRVLEEAEISERANAPKEKPASAASAPNAGGAIAGGGNRAYCPTSTTQNTSNSFAPPVGWPSFR